MRRAPQLSEGRRPQQGGQRWPTSGPPPSPCGPMGLAPALSLEPRFWSSKALSSDPTQAFARLPPFPHELPPF